MPEPTYTVAEIARRFRVSDDTVRRWIVSGQLHAIDVSGRRLSKRPRYAVPAASLAAFELRRAVGAPLPAVARRHKQPAGVIEFY